MLTPIQILRSRLLPLLALCLLAGGPAFAQAATTISPSSSANPSVSGQPVTFTLGITSTAGTVNEGTVQFQVNGADFGSAVPVVNGTASSAADSSLVATVGTYTITMTYSDLAGNFAGNAVSYYQDVSAAGTTTTISTPTPASPQAVGTSVTFQATVATVAPGSGTAAGTVNFSVNGGAAIPETLNGSGVASYTTTTLPDGDSSVTATYTGDGVLNQSPTSTAVPYDSQLASTTTITTSSANPSVAGEPVAFTATVTGAGVTPTGSVQFKVGGTNLGTPVTLSGGTATSIADSSLTVAGSPYTITGTFIPGDDNYSASSSDSSFMQQVGAGLSATIAANPTITTYPGSSDLTVTISGGTGPYTVEFLQGATVLQTDTNVTGPTDSYNVTGLAGSATPYSFTAQVTDSETTPQMVTTSPAATVTVNPTTSTTSTVSSSANPSVAGAPVTFTATVTGAGTTPTGTVQFEDATGADIGTPQTLDGTGTATLLNYTGLTAAGSPYSIKAYFTPGDTNYAASNSSTALTQTVGAGLSASIAANPTITTYPGSSDLTVTISGGTGPYTVEFYQGATLIQTDTNVTGPTDSYTVTGLAGSATPYSFTAQVTDSETTPVTATTSPAATVTVSPTTSTTSTVSSSANPSVDGAPVTFTATVTGAGATPTGTVQFKDATGADIGTPQTLDGTGTATLSNYTGLTAAGSPYSIKAYFTPGDKNYFASSSNTALTQDVNATLSATIAANPTTTAYPGSSALQVTIAGGTGPYTVEFYQGATLIQTDTNVTGPTDSYTVTGLAESATPYSYTATVTDSETTPVMFTTSPAATVTVGPATTTTTITGSSVNPSVSGAPVTFTATVTSTAGTPSGTVQFEVNGTPFGTAVNLVGGTATSAADSSLTATSQITAYYTSTDPNYADSDDSASPYTQTVYGLLSASIAANPTTTNYPGSSLLTVTIGGGLGPYTVVYSENGTPIQTDTGVIGPTDSYNVTGLAASATPYSFIAKVTDSALGVSAQTATTSPPATVTVGPAATTTTITGSSVNPSVSGVPVTFTATVTSTAGTPSGTVQFEVNGTPFGTPVNLVGGTATSAADSSLTATSQITAYYTSTDTNYADSDDSASPYTQTIYGVLSASIAANPTTTNYPGSSLLTVTIGGGLGPYTVVYSENGTPIQTDTGVIGPTDSYNVTGLAASATPYSFIAKVTDSALGVSAQTATTSPPATVTVGQSATTTTVASSANPSVSGQSVTFTATVAGAGTTPTGTVQFQVNGTDLGTPVTLSGGTATSISDSSLVASDSPYTITAFYSGDGNNLASDNTALPLIQSVGQPATTTSLSVSPPSPQVVGTSVTFTATVAAVAPGIGIPTGTVDFDVNGTIIPETLDGTGVASYTTTTLPDGNSTITATYVSDGNFAGSVSSTITYNSLLASTTTITGSSDNPSVSAEPVTFTATVTGTGTTPSGTVQFQVNGVDLGTPVTLSGGTATSIADPSLLASGSPYTVSGVYNGDVNYGGSSSGPFTQTVNQAGTTATLSASPTSPQAFGTTVTFTATIAGIAPSLGTPTDGFVEFSVDGGTPFNEPVNASGTASYVTNSLSYNSHTVSATYTGDANYLASAVSNSVTYVISPTTTTISTVMPNSGLVGSSVTFTIIGYHFGTSPTVYFNGAPISNAQLTSISDNSITVTGFLIPPTPGIVPITVFNPTTQEISNGVGFTVISVTPTVSSIVPSTLQADDPTDSGPDSAAIGEPGYDTFGDSALVTISGTNFRSQTTNPGGFTYVEFVGSLFPNGLILSNGDPTDLPTTPVGATILPNLNTQIFNIAASGDSLAVSAPAGRAATVAETQDFSLLGAPTGGTFTLSYNGQTTPDIAFDATPAQVQTALNSLSVIPSPGVTVTEVSGSYVVNFPTGALIANLSGSAAGLTVPSGNPPAQLTITNPVLQTASAVIDLIRQAGQYQVSVGTFTKQPGFGPVLIGNTLASASSEFTVTPLQTYASGEWHQMSTPYAYPSLSGDTTETYYDLSSVGVTVGTGMLIPAGIYADSNDIFGLNESTYYSPAATALTLFTWDPVLQYQQLADSSGLALGTGYWLYSTAGNATPVALIERGYTPAQALLTGTNLFDTKDTGDFPILLSPGWNLIGDPSTTSELFNNIRVRSRLSNSSISTDPEDTMAAAFTAGILSPYIYTYDTNISPAGYVQDTDELSPYIGYWVYAYTPCTLLIPVQ